MASAVEELVPYGVCPVATCPYSERGASEHRLSCPDHARLHAYVDHKYSFSQVGKGKFDNPDFKIPQGTKATLRLNPRGEGGMEAILRGL